MAWGLKAFGATAWGYGDISTSVTSDTLTVSVGDEATIADANVTAVTNLMTMSMSNVRIDTWTDISEDQSPGWGDITTTQTPVWGDITTTQTPAWSDISTL